MLLFYILVFFSMDIRDQEIDEWRVIDSIQSLLDFLMDDEFSFNFMDDEMFSFSFEDSMDLECCCVIFYKRVRLLLEEIEDKEEECQRVWVVWFKEEEEGFLISKRLCIRGLYLSCFVFGCNVRLKYFKYYVWDCYIL